MSELKIKTIRRKKAAVTLNEVMERVDEVANKVDKMMEKISPTKPRNILDDIFDKMGHQEMCLTIADKQTESKWVPYWIALANTSKENLNDLQIDKIKKAWHKLHSGENLENHLRDK